ncbi:MAG: site-specific integrase [Solirubrobacterales bacterium]|nr:site-specific integrase [Solirubrobacterales bacterium]
MSVERIEREGGIVWRVRWRDDQGRNRSKVLGRKRDAEAFDAEVRRLKRTRELGHLDAGKQTLSALGEDWWRLYAAGNLARATQESYASAWDTHVLPCIGGMELRHLDTAAVLQFRADLEEAGVGPYAVRKSLAVLHVVLARAVEWGRIPNNPATSVRKPTVKRKRAVVPLTPADVEAIRARLLEQGRLRDATVISVLAYAGLRPGEALALTWRHVGRRSLLVDGAIAYGEVTGTKTGRARSVTLLAPLAEDLALWRQSAEHTGAEDLVFPGVGKLPWSREAYKSWARRAYADTAEAVGLSSRRPYDLRHSFISLLIQEGRSVVEVAMQAGHAPTMTLSTYAHVFAEMGPEDRVSPEEEIRRVRARMYPFCTSPGICQDSEPTKSLQILEALHRIRTDDPFLTMEVLYH